MRRPAPLPKTTPAPDARFERTPEPGEVSEAWNDGPLAGAQPTTPADGAEAAGQARPGTLPDAMGVLRGAARSTGAASVADDSAGSSAEVSDAESGAGDPASVRPMGWRDVWRAARARRRALRREVRRFTARSRRRRLGWSAGGAAVVLLVVGSVGAAYSPLFAVERIAVVGTATLPAGLVEDALWQQLGRPLPLIDESEIKAALVGFPLVESYTLEAQPPHDLVVRVVERTPIGVIEGTAGWNLVDAAGVVLETSPTAPEGRPVLEIRGGTRSDAFESAGLVMRALPDGIRAQVTRVSATTRDDVTLTLGATGTEVVWGSVEETPQKAYILETAMRSRPPESASLFDVSSPHAIIIR